MRNYSDYRIDDFAMDPDFIRWVLDPHLSDHDFWPQWLQENPHRLSDISAARLIVASMHIEEVEISQELVLQGMDKVLAQSGLGPARPTVFRFRFWLAAASLLVLVSSALILYKSFRSITHKNRPLAVSVWAVPVGDSLVEQANAGLSPKIIRLSDSSIITLQPGASIRYYSAFLGGNTRSIYLKGNADFQVEKVSNKPFLVYSQELITRVLGTSFTIKADGTAQDIKVIVHSGKVSVCREGEADSKGKLSSGTVQRGVILTPNQELVYNRTPRIFQKSLIDTPELVNPVAIKHDFVYEDIPVTEVLEEFKSAFDIDIEYDKEVLKDCRISANLSDESITKKLDLICAALGAKYEMIDGAVSIQAHPCK